jgi:hypothetical protein
MAEFIGGLVEAASVRPAGPLAVVPLRCRRRPRRRPCQGFLRVQYTRLPSEIHWVCPACGDNGLILNWQKSDRDLSELPEFEDDGEDSPRVEVLLDEADYEEVRRAGLLDLEAERTLLRATPAADGIRIEAGAAEVDHLLGFIAAAANHEERARRRRVLDRVWEQIADALSEADPAKPSEVQLFADGIRKLLEVGPSSPSSRARRASTSRQPAARKPRGAKGDVYRLRIDLLGISPPVRRAVLVPGEITLGRLHRVIQGVMGWTDSHLHRFEVGGQWYAVPHPDDPVPVRDERRARLCDLTPERGATLRYIYDFGDRWAHEIVVEAISPADASQPLPICVAGARACPPENSGGTLRYEELLLALRDPSHPGFEELREIVGASFDPDAFDLEAVNRRLLSPRSA